ncbi:MAG: amidohydrolase, partial [Sphingopyxis sp.]|nr:amidohydrolase [Sphingopyxis sp.]
MGAEDFGNFWRADNSIRTMIFWVGGTPLADWQAAQANGTPLPSLHSPFWAPDAEAVIGTASEALAAMAMDIMKPAA